MNAEVRRAYWVHYKNAEGDIRQCKDLLTEIEGELLALRRAMHDDPSLLENGFAYVVNRADELATYAREIQDSIRRKRQDGAEADARIDLMIGAVH